MTSILEKIQNNEIDYREADAGIVNRTYITKDYVVQTPDMDEGEKLRKNRYLLDRVKDAGGPVPRVVNHSEDPLFTVFEKIEGELLDNREEFGDRYLEAVRGAGRALAAIHQVEGEGYGNPDPETGFQEGQYEEWRGFVDEYIQGTVNFVESDHFQPVAEKASQMADTDIFPEKPDSKVLHLDYTTENIIIDDEMEAHVIDFDDAKYGDPRFDIMYARFVMSKRGSDVEDAFMDGYRDERDPGFTDRLERGYKVLAIVRDLRGGEWCLKNDRDVDLDRWKKGLEDALNELEE